MTDGVKTIIYPVTDIASAKALYTTLLGVEPVMDKPYYVGYRVADQDIGLDPNGHRQGMTGPVPYWHVDDLEAVAEALLGSGAEVVQEAKDVGGGKLVATLKDADGNLIGLIQPA
jgi:predicted enzyme related to lactoylglutathione lyase